MSKRGHLLTIALATAFALSGCVLRDNDSLPNQSSTTREATLANFTGSYRLVEKSEKQRIHDTYDVIGALINSERKIGDVLQLKASKRLLLVRYQPGSKPAVMRSIDMDSSSVRLEQGRLIDERPMGGGIPIFPGPMLSSGTKLSMYFGDDNNLILVGEWWEAAAPFLIFPFYESQRRVYRFERIGDN
jgi:hypothetical protein